ncbi:hypothetical protein K2173_028490 [Erythroxylum novogranatense]|uniref:PWWP domain-containing protein n=1 Tax=Erythroxylum novogranatense TaxID=1862640 RepID=A0AAV8U627_9ROSI|nr:hypothetical protein K2173_028490 [Erythroxylum novogranatense]
MSHPIHLPGFEAWHCGSWWPAVVVNENAVSRTSKPGTKSTGDVLARLYGSCQHLYVDPTKLRSEFESTLKENNGCYREILLKSLQQAHAHAIGNLSKRQQSKTKGALSEAVDVSEEKNVHRVNQKRTSSNKSTSPGNALCNASAKGAKSKLPKQISMKTCKRKCPEQLQTPKSGTSLRGGSEELSARRRKVMQTLGLIAPSGSPFGKDGCLLSGSLL